MIKIILTVELDYINNKFDGEADIKTATMKLFNNSTITQNWYKISN